MNETNTHYLKTKMLVAILYYFTKTNNIQET